MIKRGEADVPLIILSIFGLFTLGLGISYMFFALNGPDYSSTYDKRISSGEIKNFAKEFNITSGNVKGNIIIKTENIGNLSASDIEKEMINYATVSTKLYNLHNVPFTSITPKIQFDVGENSYNIEIKKGEIILGEGEIKNEDIIIKTTQEEIIKMMEDDTYTKESFSSGNSNVELVANKFVLFSKGYSSLYGELN